MFLSVDEALCMWKEDSPYLRRAPVPGRETDRNATNWNVSDYDKCDNRDINKLVWRAHEHSLEGQAKTSQRR